MEKKGEEKSLGMWRNPAVCGEKMWNTEWMKEEENVKRIENELWRNE